MEDTQWFQVRFTAVFLNTTPARLATTPGDNHNVSVVEGRDEVAPLAHFDYVVRLLPS